MYVGTRVNGRLVPLKALLKSGDSIEIITSANQHPSKDWLKFCVTPRAKSKIRAYVKNEERKRALDMGREILEKEFRKFGHNLQKALKDSNETQEKLKSFGVTNAERFVCRCWLRKNWLAKMLLSAFPRPPKNRSKRNKRRSCKKSYKVKTE